MFKKLLIANRGEIACRVIGTARRMGIATVAVYSEADAGALNVQEADEAIAIGPAPARDSYLNIVRILDAARDTGAEAVHPGYGFLAENADFAAACGKAGLVFVGPSAEAIRAMGSKAAAKQLMALADVPTVPGYHGEDQGPARLTEEARRIGYPVLIKASSGGGGKGMRVVERPDEFAAALGAAKRESLSAFADDRVLIEKYLDRPRHVEVQIFADRFGDTVHLFERDCSMQRRHQKVIEEAPAPKLDDDLRRALHATAIAAARAIRYVNAGTIEFILQGDSFYFMEMNTRLQVEHPVTEMITGLDLVEWQLRVAAGEALPLRQDQIAARGHAVEARLYAEDATRDFLPAAGTLRLLRAPDAAADLRIETGVRQGDTVTPYYDPMIAKLAAWGEDRAAASQRLAEGLSQYRIAGVVTNRDFLRRLVRDPAFAAGEIDTGFIARHRDRLVPPSEPAHEAVLAAATREILLGEEETTRKAASRSRDRYSPWRLRDGWRLDGRATREFHWRDGDTEGVFSLSAHWAERNPDITVARHGDEFTIIDDDATWRLILIDPLAAKEDAAVVAGRLTAPMPGKIVQVLAGAGESVKRGQPLLILEAMKMEHTIVAPGDGTVERIHFAAGDLVQEGAELVAFTPAGQSP
jgi:3-methylcrotonyl-CoA carboxylase alpha subunit